MVYGKKIADSVLLRTLSSQDERGGGGGGGENLTPLTEQNKLTNALGLQREISITAFKALFPRILATYWCENLLKIEKHL